MEPISPTELRSLFVNVTKGAASRIPLPDLGAAPWEALDYFGWRDPGNPSAAWLVASYDGRPCGVALRLPSASGPSRRQSMCSLCHTVHSASGVALMAAARAGRAGRDGNTVGTYLCTDLACSLYARGLKPLTLPQGETMAVPERVERLQARLTAFVDRALRTAGAAAG